MTDPRAGERRFDPRFDPAFQPGYDPDSDPSIAARSTPRRFDAVPPSQLTPPERIAPPEYPVPARTFAASSAEPASSAPAKPVATTSAASSSMDELFPEAGTVDEPAQARGVNPFSVTLWVISVVLVAAGIAMFRSLPGIEQQGLLSTGETSTTSYGQVFSLAVLSAVLVGSGILGAVGNLFVLAARWSSGRS